MYDRKWKKSKLPKKNKIKNEILNKLKIKDVLKKILSNQNICSKEWIWQQYDHTVMGDTIQKPGGDSGVVRVHGTNKAVAASVDSSAVYCWAHPLTGGKQVVAESWRNLISVGAKPIAITNCLKFGSPEKEDNMGEFVECVQGIGEASKYLNFPVVSGNVSFYNQTKEVGIKPTPSIGGVGLIKDYKKMISMDLKKEGKPVIGFGAGEPDFASPDYVINEVKIAAEDPKNHKYSPVAGLESLRKEISRTTLKYSGVGVTEDNVVVSNGGKQAIVTALMSVLDPGDEVIIPAPYWTTYPEAVKLAGGEPVFIKPDKKDNFKISVSDLEKAKNSKTKLLIWCSPSNPTGVVYSKEESEEIYNWVFENDIWILSDELYEHLVYEGKTSPSPGQYDKELKNTIIINGVSKAYAMTGWRVGWLVANSNVIGLAKKIQSQISSNVSNISQIAAETALKNGLDATEEMKISFNRRRLYAIEKINEINLSLIHI